MICWTGGNTTSLSANTPEMDAAAGGLQLLPDIQSLQSSSESHCTMHVPNLPSPGHAASQGTADAVSMGRA